MLDAEEEALKEDSKNSLPSIEELEEEAAQEAMQWLCDPASIEVFTTWYTFGGSQAGITPMEAMNMPGWLRRDFSTILSVLGRERTRRRRAEKRKGKRK